jgi:aspartate aminotransferase-like enzyme
MAPLFVPGPVDVDEEVAQAQTAPMLPHRSAEFEEIFHRAEGKARKLFYTENRVFISASSGTGFHEAAVRNFVPDNGRVLSCANGAFGNRWHDVAKTNGKQVDKLDGEWGKPITAEMVAEALDKNSYDAVLVVHNETSTGLMNPIKEIAAVVKDLSPDTLVCVDAVSSFSGAKIETDAWGLDFVLTSSQKALAMPPGLALAATSDRALAKAETVENRGWYFDLVRLEKHRVNNSTPATPVVGLIYALDKQLDRIFAEGAQNRFDRHTAMMEHTHNWALANGFGVFAADGFQSRTVSAIDNKREIDLGEFNKYIAPKDMRVAGGYGALKGKTFRIAHMGELTIDDLNTLFAEFEAFLN